jgi:hypothetical protein
MRAVKIAPRPGKHLADRVRSIRPLRASQRSTPTAMAATTAGISSTAEEASRLSDPTDKERQIRGPTLPTCE